MGPTWDINKEFSFTKSPSPASKAPSSLGASYAGLGVRRRPCLLSVWHTKRPQTYFLEQFGVYGSLQEYLFQVRFSRTYSADGRQLSRSSLGPRKCAPSSTSTGREGRKGMVPSPSEKRLPVGRLRFRERSNVLCPLTWQRNNVKRSDFNACHFFNNTLLWTFKAFYFFFFLVDAWKIPSRAITESCHLHGKSSLVQRNLTEYFVAVDVNNMLHLFASMLHERRIIITSGKLSTVSASHSF